MSFENYRYFDPHRVAPKGRESVNTSSKYIQKCLLANETRIKLPKFRNKKNWQIRIPTYFNHIEQSFVNRKSFSQNVENEKITVHVLSSKHEFENKFTLKIY